LVVGERLNILVYPAQTLLEPCESVGIYELPGLQGFIDAMIYTMFHSGGVGLAAPQVGKNIRIFVIDQAPINGNEADDPWVFAVQHENDHLNGRLMNALASKKDARKIEKIFRQSGPIAIYKE
jgi:peptide deformylase